MQSAPFDGGWQIGIAFGNRVFNINPGFPGGEFLILDSTSGDSLIGPLDMGFTPSTFAFHTMQLSWKGDLNQVTIEVADGDGVASPFQFVWTPDVGFDPTGPIGFDYFNGGGEGGIASFDDLVIVPEPGTCELLVIGLLGLMKKRARVFRDLRWSGTMGS